MAPVEERKVFFTENMPANKYRRLNRIRKWLLDTPNKIIKDHQWILTQRNVDQVLQCQRIIYNQKGKPFKWWDLVSPTWTSLVNLASPTDFRRYRKHCFDPWVREIPWSRKWQPTPVFLPGKFHGQRSLTGYIQSMGLQRVGHDWACAHANLVVT